MIRPKLTEDKNMLEHIYQLEAYCDELEHLKNELLDMYKDSFLEHMNTLLYIKDKKIEKLIDEYKELECQHTDMIPEWNKLVSENEWLEMVLDKALAKLEQISFARNEEMVDCARLLGKPFTADEFKRMFETELKQEQEKGLL